MEPVGIESILINNEAIIYVVKSELALECLIVIIKLKMYVHRESSMKIHIMINADVRDQ